MRKELVSFLFATIVADGVHVTADSDSGFFKQPPSVDEGPSQCANLLSSPWSTDQTWIDQAAVALVSGDGDDDDTVGVVVDDDVSGDAVSSDFLFMHIPKTAGTSFGGKQRPGVGCL